VCVSHAAICAPNTPTEPGLWARHGSPGIHMSVNRANNLSLDKHDFDSPRNRHIALHNTPSAVTQFPVYLANGKVNGTLFFVVINFYSKQAWTSTRTARRSLFVHSSRSSQVQLLQPYITLINQRSPQPLPNHQEQTPLEMEHLGGQGQAEAFSDKFQTSNHFCEAM